MKMRRMLVSMMRSLQWKLVFMFFAITILLMMFVYFFLNFQIAPLYYANLIKSVDKGFNTLSPLSVYNSESFSYDSLSGDDKRNLKNDLKNYLYTSFPLNDNMSVTVFDLKRFKENNPDPILFSNDTVYAKDKDKFIRDIQIYSENLLNYFQSLNLVDGRYEGKVQNTEYIISSVDREYYEYLRPDRNGRFFYYFIYEKTAWDDITSSFNAIILKSSALAIIIALILGYMLSKTITGPVVKIMHKAQKLAAGDFEQSIEVRSDDEIGKLSKAFNFMAKELKNTMTEQQRLENMRREFVANVSHELKTPITSIKSYSETLLDGCLEDTETATRFLHVINSEADRMTRLVRDLLQLSSIDNAQMKWNMKPFNIGLVVQGIVDRLQMEADHKKQTIVFEKTDGLPEIKGDSDRLEQVFVNVISNAIKYTPESGTITVNISQTGSFMTIRVKDTGIGIPAADLPRIFERFYRVDKARSREMGGTGLGLAIAKEIIDSHGGGIYANSVEGQGTEIIIELPVIGI